MASTEWYELLNNGSVTGDEADSLKSTATTGVMQITGPAAATVRVVTIPDANSTMARTDAAQSFTGAQTFLSAAVFDSDTGITAFATGGQASATALAGQFNNVTTCATASDSVKLPAAVAGASITVKNSGAAALAVFPASGDAINALAVNLSVDIAVGGQMTFRAIDGTTWETEEFLISQAPSTQKGSLVVKATDNDGNTVTTLTNAAMGQASVISFPDPGAATANVVLTSAANDGALVTATSVELNYNDITTLGTLAASKTWTSDASLDTVMPTGGLLTVQSGGAVTFDSGATLTLSGALVQAPVFVADASPYTVLAADSGKLHIILEQTNSITLNLPVIAAGLGYKFVMGGVATEAQNWVIVATTPSFYNGGIVWTDLDDAESNVAVVYANGTSHLTLTVTTPAAGTEIEIYSNGTEWFVHGAVISDSTPAFT